MKMLYAIIGDYYHPGELIQQSLELALKPLLDGGQYGLKYIAAEALAMHLEEKPAAIILYKEDRVNPKDDTVQQWLTESVSEAISGYVEAGGGFLAWHSGLASYPTDSAFIKMLRGYFEYHPSKHQIVSYKGSLPADQSQEVSFDIVDEHYFVSYDEGNTHVFLWSESIDGSSIGGWHHSFGQGKVCCLTPAHKQEGLLHQAMIDLLRSSMQVIL